MPTYQERYQQGEHQQVWAELVALGPAVRHEPLLSDARAVAQTMMARARQNVGLVVERLHALDYRFAHPQQVWLPPDHPEMRGRLELIVRQYGPLPLTLQAWFDVVGFVSLVGAHPKLSCYTGLVPLDRQGPLSDPLVVACYSSVEEYEEEEEGPPYAFDFAPDPNHKARMSGGWAAHVDIPAPGFDAPVVSTWWNGLPFVPYLRTAFQWGGFLGFERAPAAAADAQAELAALTAGLLQL